MIGRFADIADRINQGPALNYQRILRETAHGGVDPRRLSAHFENPFGRRQRFAVGKILNNAHGDRVEFDRLVTHISDLVLCCSTAHPR